MFNVQNCAKATHVKFSICCSNHVNPHPRKLYWNKGRDSVPGVLNNILLTILFTFQHGSRFVTPRFLHSTNVKSMYQITIQQSINVSWNVPQNWRRYKSVPTICVCIHCKLFGVWLFFFNSTQLWHHLLSPVGYIYLYIFNFIFDNVFIRSALVENTAWLHERIYPSLLIFNVLFVAPTFCTKIRFEIMCRALKLMSQILPWNILEMCHTFCKSFNLF